ncbi:DEAD/DEAH box helicase [Streptococcus suis]|uniref:DNA helicase-like protein n=2 Tax=Streptococcus suis TaxID=1307 RepID=A0A0Z8EBK9_STRSU|nr:DEAD/DEAH box helicase [Streptococcus suis]MCK3947672.1 DEAD/DEAH box helicase [Streptococcus suis]MCK3962733.1 DEAD/DEAH box helicase [Streptococcus suis]MCK3990603.1 DEAD/DEAH box helicase [Streptococcus suis]MDE1696379.1 DEAD/DEAH box helicase [Streptococcus suis]MDW8744962.1 DEAD/DEAH box helicase [Streptococcus suis]
MVSQSDGGKNLLTRIKNSKDLSKNIINLLYKKKEISSREAEFLFSIALVIMEEYQKDIGRQKKDYLINDKYLLIEFAYKIIAITCFKIENFRALYDFSVNYGYYPIARKILDDNLISTPTMHHIISNLDIEDFVDDGKVKTLEQNKVFKQVLSSVHSEISFLAPTSYGKSELIFEHLKANCHFHIVAIIVPTKALIDQTFREAKKKIMDRKIIIHDQNYNLEKDTRVLAIVTQERALRLIEEGMVFDVLYIDEAHELLNFNFRDVLSNRSLLLARLIRISKTENPNIKLIYLSPTIQDIANLVLVGGNPIQSYEITNNLKILDIKYINKDNVEFVYDLFLDCFIEIGKVENQMDHISNTSQKFSKNLHFLYRPKWIESYTEQLYSSLPLKVIPKDIKSLQEELQKIVHPKFKLIKYLSRGIVYLHGRLPLIIRNYLLKYVRESHFLQNFVANSVVLAGMNLPIDNLIYITGFKSPSDLNNLIGRVNRLNDIFKSGERLSKILIPVHFIDMETYPQNKGGNLEKKIKSLRGRSVDNVRNPMLEQFTDTKQKNKVEEIRNVENRIIEKYTTPDFFTQLNKAGAQQVLNYTDAGMQKLEDVIKRTSVVSNKGDIHQNILNKMKEVFFDTFVTSDKQIDLMFFSPSNNIKRLRYEATIDYYKNFVEFSFNNLHDRIENLVGYWKKVISGEEISKNKNKDINYFVYVGPQFGEVPYETDSYKGEANVYIDLRSHSEDEDYLYNMAVIKIQIDEDFIGHEITLLLNTLKEFKIITGEQFDYFLYKTFDKREIEVLRLGISRNIYQLMKNDNQIQNIVFDSFGNARANDQLRQYIETKKGIEKFELEQYFT